MHPSSRRWARVVLGGCLALLAGCGGGGGGTPTVFGPTLSQIALSPLTVSLAPGATQQLTVTATYSDGTTKVLTASSETFTSSNTAVASVSAAGIVTVATGAASGAKATISAKDGASGLSTSTANSTVVTVAPSTPGASNTLAVTVDGGPANVNAANTLYATVTICAHGSTTNCQALDHVQVDTQSFGLRVISEALTVSGLVPNSAGGGDALLECTVFADGYAWGPVTNVDVTIGGETVSNLPIQVIGDPNYINDAPSSCMTNSMNHKGLTPENTVATFGANGILGVGVFAQDCGSYCASASNAQVQNYYACTTAGACTPTVVALAQQVQNPVPLFAKDNNGVILSLPAVTAPGEATVSGTLTFGIGTQANNAYAAANLYDLDANGYLKTVFGGATLSAFLDSGSNAYFFDDSSIASCTASGLTGFYCPSSTQSLNAQIQATSNGHASTVDFSIQSAATLQQSPYFVLPTLGGPAGSTNSGNVGLSGNFDWGLPFFYGRTVYFAVESASVSGVASAGPWNAF